LDLGGRMFAVLIFLALYLYGCSITGDGKIGANETVGAVIAGVGLIAGSFIDHKFFWTLF